MTDTMVETLRHWDSHSGRIIKYSHQLCWENEITIYQVLGKVINYLSNRQFCLFILQYFEFFSKVVMKPYSFYKLNSRAEKLTACFAIALKNLRLTYFETILIQNHLEGEVFLEF